MSDEYVTSELNLPPDPEGEEITVQVTDKETKEIFSERARISRDPEDLADPAPLTVVKGPHENTEEQWYIDFLGTDVGDGTIDGAVLESVMADVAEGSNVINTRSEEVKVLLRYLVETGEYSSVSAASREIQVDYLSEAYPELVEEYVERKVRSERSELFGDGAGDA